MSKMVETGMVVYIYTCRNELSIEEITKKKMMTLAVAHRKASECT
jgi:hypothetical protein